MIATISNGAAFGGIVNYAYDILAKNTEILGMRNIDISSHATITAGFKLQAMMKPNVSKCVGHFSLSFSPEDKPKMTNEFMRKFTEDYMQRMGITDTQYVIFRHHDHDHDHVHVVYNRIDNNGKVISDRHDRKRSQAISRKMTREYHLSFGKDKEKVHRERLKGKDKVKYAIFDAAKVALNGSHSWKEFIQRMAEQGITVKFRSRPNDKGLGITFTKDNVTFSGSKVDRSLTFNQLDKLLVGIDLIDTSSDEIAIHQR